MNKVDMQT